MCRLILLNQGLGLSMKCIVLLSDCSLLMVSLTLLAEDVLWSTRCTSGDREGSKRASNCMSLKLWQTGFAVRACFLSWTTQGPWTLPPLVCEVALCHL